MKRTIIITAIFLGVLLGAALWLGARETTLRWVVDQASQRFDGRLKTSGVGGSLYGPIRVRHLEFRNDGTEITVEDAEVDWAPTRLLMGQLGFDLLHAKTVILVLPPTTDKPPPQPESLAPPLGISLADVRIDQLAVTREGVTRQLSDVSLALSGNARIWKGEIKSLRTPWGAAKGDAEVAVNRPFALSGVIELAQSESPVYAAAAILSGSLLRAQIAAGGAAQGATAKVSLVLTPFAENPLEQIDANAAGINPQAWHAAAPAADVGLQLKAEGIAEKKVRGELLVSNTKTGTLDRDLLPIASAKASFEGPADDLILSDVLFDLGDGGKLAGNGAVKDAVLDLTVRADNLNLRGLHGKLRATQLAGEAAVSGDGTAQRMKLALKQGRYRFAFNGAIEDATLTVARAQASAGDSELVARGTLALDAAKSFAVNGTLSQFDPAQFGDFSKANINSRFTAAGEISPVLQVKADVNLHDSRLFGLPAVANGKLRSRGLDKPDLGFDMTAKIGDTQVEIKGAMIDPAALRSLDLQMVLEGRDLAQLYPIIGVPLPPTPPYKLAGRLMQRDQVWEFRKFTGRVGSSDLAGDFLVDRRKIPQFMRGDLVSNNLDLKDLAGFIGASGDEPKPIATGSTEKARTGRVLPDDPFSLEKLKAADADIRFNGRRIVTEKLPLRDMSAHLVLTGGRLTLDPLNFGVAAGNIVSQISLDARQPVIVTVADIQAKGLQLNQLFPDFKLTGASVGEIDGRARLTTHGNSIAAMLGSADGNAALVMNGGEISELLLRLTNLDLANAAAAMLKGNKNIPVHCLVADFAAENGDMRPRTLVLDTSHTNLTGTGEINFATETLDLKFEAKPKDNSLLALRGPILVKGQFGSPAVRPDLKSVAGRGGAAAVLGVVATPFAALLPFVELGNAKDTDCAPLLARARQFIDPTAVTDMGGG